MRSSAFCSPAFPSVAPARLACNAFQGELNASRRNVAAESQAAAVAAAYITTDLRRLLDEVLKYMELGVFR